MSTFQQQQNPQGIIKGTSANWRNQESIKPRFSSGRNGSSDKEFQDSVINMLKTPMGKAHSNARQMDNISKRGGLSKSSFKKLLEIQNAETQMKNDWDELIIGIDKSAWGEGASALRTWQLKHPKAEEQVVRRTKTNKHSRVSRKCETATKGTASQNRSAERRAKTERDRSGIGHNSNWQFLQINVRHKLQIYESQTRTSRVNVEMQETLDQTILYSNLKKSKISQILKSRKDSKNTFCTEKQR